MPDMLFVKKSEKDDVSENFLKEKFLISIWALL